MRSEWKEWEEDLDPDAVAREAAADIKERVPLPEVGESITVTFLEEPRKVPRSGLASTGTSSWRTWTRDRAR